MLCPAGLGGSSTGRLRRLGNGAGGFWGLGKGAWGFWGKGFRVGFLGVWVGILRSGGAARVARRGLGFVRPPFSVSLFCFLCGRGRGVFLVRPWGWGFLGFGDLGVLGGVRCRIFWKRIFFSLYAPFLFFYAFFFRGRERSLQRLKAIDLKKGRIRHIQRAKSSVGVT